MSHTANAERKNASIDEVTSSSSESPEASPSKASQAGSTASPSAEQVAEYLSQNPDFFTDRADLIESLRLPHAKGAAVSLVERQLEVLRDRNAKLHTSLTDMLEVAQRNDQLFDNSKHLVLELLNCDAPEAMAASVESNLQKLIGVDAAKVILLGDNESDHNKSLQHAQECIGGLLNTDGTVCGQFRDTELAFLLGDDAEQIKSAAMATVGAKQQPVAIIALGSNNGDEFRSGMGTVFLDYIRDVMAILLPQKAG